MRSSILIQNARVVDPSQAIDKVMDLFIDGGVIKELGTTTRQAGLVIDAHGLVAAPGLVDMHVHLRDPGYTQKEDIFSGCKAAAAGGVTSLLAMPNTNPVADNAQTVRYILDKAKQADANVYVAASITKGLKSEQACDIKELKDAGAIALTDDGRPVENTLFMAQAMVQAPKNQMTVVAHCEDLHLAGSGIINAGKVAKSLQVKGVPAAAEDTGTAREIALAAAYNVPVHICHVSTKTSVALIRDAKNRGVAVTAETAPHYFAFTQEALLKRDADFRMNPPLRTQQDKEAIIQALRDGTIDAIATDHAPHTSKDKADFAKAPNGVVGMETSLAAGLTFLVHTKQLTLAQLIDKMSCTPARLLHIQAGTLKEGAPADLVLFDLNESYMVDAQRLHGKSKNTPFKGMTLKGKVKKTILRGQIVYEDTNR